MDQTTRSVNFILVCIVNGYFMVAGVFLNVVVIISLSKNQLLKKLCYFMILILTCFDLATVTVCHPWITISSYIWSTGDHDVGNIYHRIRKYTNILSHFSFLALLTLNIDRFLAIRYPLFHKTSVTRRRLVALLLVLLLALLVERVLAYRNIFGIICYAAEAVFIGFLLVVVFLINYKMFTIAKAARKRKSTPVKNISTCILAVACFVLFSTPLIVYSAMQFAPNKFFDAENAMLFSLWARTFACMNSSVNCLIFFWKDGSLRGEGMKIFKRLCSWKIKTLKLDNKA